MRIVLDKVDADFYGDIVLTEKDIEAIQRGEIVEAHAVVRKQVFYLGAFLRKGLDDEEKRYYAEEDESSDG